MRRRELCEKLAAYAIVAPRRTGGFAAPALRDIAAARNIRFGTEVTMADLDADSNYGALIAHECDIVTPGIEAKWAYTEPHEGMFRFGPMDRLADFARRRGLRLHMHNLIWAVGLPKWTLAAIAEGREASVMARHIGALVSRYQDKVDSWDVINEPADPRWPSGPEGLCTTPWRQGLGPAFVRDALTDTSRSNPRAKLLINDDDLEYEAPDRTRKRDTYIRLLSALKEQDVPLHGFGLEAHLKPWRTIADREYRRFLRQLGDLGLQIYVTELDVCDRTLPPDIASRDAAVAAMTKRYLDIVLDEPATTTIMTWGLSDRTTWMQRDPAGQRPDRLPPRPLPYDNYLNAKPMRAALVSALSHARHRPPREG